MFTSTVVSLALSVILSSESIHPGDCVLVVQTIPPLPVNPIVHDPQSCHSSSATDLHGLVDGRISTIGSGAAEGLEDGPARLGVRLAGDDAALAVGAVAREAALELDAGVALAAVQGLGHDVSDVLGAEVEAEDDGGLDAKDALQDFESC